MRALVGAITVAVLTTMVGVAAAPVASAGVAPLSCTFTVTPTQLDGPATVQVSGTAPGTTEVGIQLDGVTVVTVVSAPVTGEWGPVAIDIVATTTVTIALPESYATLPCIGNGGTDTVRIVVGGSATGRLPTTGSDTGRWVLLGAAAVVLGIVLVVAARRRHGVGART